MQDASRHLHCSVQAGLIPDKYADYGVQVASPNDMKGHLAVALGKGHSEEMSKSR